MSPRGWVSPAKSEPPLGGAVSPQSITEIHIPNNQEATYLSAIHETLAQIRIRRQDSLRTQDEDVERSLQVREGIEREGIWEALSFCAGTHRRISFDDRRSQPQLDRGEQDVGRHPRERALELR
jgi:hypothetical protein